MNIIEAIKSGKRFRLPNRSWIDTKEIAGIHMLQLHVGDIVCDDWEVESAPVTITREQFDAIWKKYVDRFDDAKEREAMLKELDRVARELGL